MKNASEGAATHVYAAFDPSLKDHNGAYLVDSQVWPVEKVRPWARDPVEANMLWKLSEEIVGQKVGSVQSRRRWLSNCRNKFAAAGGSPLEDITGQLPEVAEVKATI